MKTVVSIITLILGVAGWSFGQCPGPWTVLYTSGTSVTIPAGVTSVTVEAWGGGGGGGGVGGSGSAGGGGGGGYSVDTWTVTASGTINYSIGAGGTGGAGNNDGANGGNTTISYGSSTLTAGGGFGGGKYNTSGFGSNGAGGAGGTGTYEGGLGGTGTGTGSSGHGGHGGGAAGPSGNGGDATNTAVGTGNTGITSNAGTGATGLNANGAGANGINYGGGGSGAQRKSGSSSYAGGNGAPGVIRITYYCTVSNFSIGSITTNPSPLCINEAGTINVQVTNNSGAAINAGDNSHPIQFSKDNGATWSSDLDYVDNVANGATGTYSFSITSTEEGNIPIKIRVKDGASWIEKTVSITVQNCHNDPANADCASATLIQTAGTYTGFTGDMPVVTNDGSKTWLNDVVGGLTIENVGYYKFVATANTLSFYSCSSCGIQHVIFPNCGTKSGAKFAVNQAGPGVGSLTTIGSVSYVDHGGGCYTYTVNGLTPGQTYYWAVDGYSGAECNYSIKFTGGITVLNVDLINFTGKAQQNGNFIEWTTASEINNDYFVVESSTDGFNFKTVGRVEGAGSTNEKHYYSLLDPTFAPTTYYRLKQVDFDGTTTTHPLIVVERSGKNGMLVTPNPVENKLLVNVNVDEAGTYSFAFVNTMGAAVQKQVLLQKGENHIEVDVAEQLASGFYMLRVVDANGELVEQCKFVKK